MSPLDQLKDIHLPSEINWWPLAIGWWLAAFLALVVLVLLVVLFKKYRQRKQRLERGLEPFDQLAINESLSSQDWLNELSILLRRIAINVHGRNDVAGLVGSDWLSYLDNTGRTNEFSQGVGKVLAEQPYQPDVDYDRESIRKLARVWVKEQYKRGHHA